MAPTLDVPVLLNLCISAFYFSSLGLFQVTKLYIYRLRYSSISEYLPLHTRNFERYT